MGDTARLHASFETEARYDSLAALGGVGNADNPVFDPADVITHLRPGLRLDSPGSDVSFQGSARLDWQIYTGLGGPTRDLSYLGASVDGDLVFSRGGPVQFRLSDHFARSDRSSNPSLGIGSITDANALDARLDLRPGGGALEGGLGYSFGLEQYELHDVGNVGCNQTSCDGTKFAGFGSQTHTAKVDLRWRFLPKTAVLIEGAWSLRSYSSTAQNVETRPLRVYGGLVGLLTEKVRVVLKAGYENAFAQGTSENFAGVVGQAEVGWEPRETTKLAFGVLRSVEPVSDLYGWYDDWRAYGSLSVLFLGKLQLVLGGNVDQLGFANKDGRTDLQAQANGSLDYDINNLFRIGLGAVMTYRDSSEAGPFTFQRVEVFGRLAVTY